MADAYTATVVGAIGLAFSILALLLIAIIFGWLVVMSANRKTRYYPSDIEKRAGPAGVDMPDKAHRLVPPRNEGPERGSSSKKVARSERQVIKAQPLFISSDTNLKEIAYTGSAVNGAKNGTYDRKKSLETFEKTIHIVDDEEDVNNPICLPTTVSDTHTSETIRVTEGHGYTKSQQQHGYYGPYAQESEGQE